MANWKVVWLVDGVKHEVAYEDFFMAMHFAREVKGQIMKWQNWKNCSGGFWSKYF
jgi:hypothetical protein